MRLALMGALVASLSFLAIARYAQGPLWVDALWLCGGSLGLAVGLLWAIAARRLSSTRWMAWTSAVLGAGALAARAALVGQLVAGTRSGLEVDFWRMSLAVTTVVWGLLALVWGSLAVSDGWERDDESAGTRWFLLVAGGTGVATALYSVAPLAVLVGLRTNIWTVTGLFALALAAYSVGAGARALGRRLSPRRFR